MFKINNRYFFFYIFLLFSSPGYLTAKPIVSSVNVSSLSDGSEIVINGSGFLEKKGAAPPKLFDLVDKTYENGVVNRHEKSFVEGQRIRGSRKDRQTLWNKPANGSSAPQVTRLLDERRSDSDAHYVMDGADSFLGWPAAYDGSAVDHTKLYVSWYIKMRHDPRYYWAVSPREMTGQFTPGEPIKINGISGYYIGKGTRRIGKGMLHFAFEGTNIGGRLKGHTIRGVNSNASTVFPDKFAGGTGDGYEPPGHNKFIRIWEHRYGHEGIRLSWTQVKVDNVWESSPVTAGKWHLMEVKLDTKTQTLKAYVDRKLIGISDTSWRDALVGERSPTVALLGFDGKLQQYQRTEIDDIYIDDSFARVVIGNKPKFSKLSSYELQIPLTWSNNEIKIKLNYPEDKFNTGSYLYVIDQNGDVNEKGYKLCQDCKSPPSSVDATVQ